MTIDAQLSKIQEYLNKRDQTVSKISSKSTFWHIDHSLKVILGIIETLKVPATEKYRPKYNFTRFYILTTGHIPRGLGKAPKAVMANAEISVEKLVYLFEKTKVTVATLDDIPQEYFFPHPYFGDVKKKKAIRFLGIHTHHHLKIIKEISKA